MDASESLTRLINLMGEGDVESRREVIEKIYPELLEMARGMHVDFGLHGITQSRELLSEALLKIAELRRRWSDRKHFFATFAMAVRSVRVDAMRKRDRRGEDYRDELDSYIGTDDGPHCHIIDFESALQRLEQEHPDAGRVTTMKAFLNLTFQEIADDLDIPLIRARRIWELSKNRLAALLADYSAPE